MNALLVQLQKHLVWSIPGAVLLGPAGGARTNAPTDLPVRKRRV